jgi:hypothetical protein
MIPIPDAIPLVRAAVRGALGSLAPMFNGHRACYWLQAEEGAAAALVTEPPTLASLLILQSQDLGGRDASMLSLGGWEGLITVRALASSPSAAEAQMAGVASALDTLSAPSGYTIRATLERPLVLPPDGRIHTYGGIYRIALYRS